MTDETKTATIKLYRDNVPRITITYKDKKDLFKQFQKKVKELDLPIKELYWTDWDNDRSAVKTADDLFGALENNCNVRMYYSASGDDGLFTCPCSDDDEEKDEEKVADERNESRSRSPSPAPRRSRSRSAVSTRLHAQPSHGQMSRNIVPWQFMMDPRFAPISFLHYPNLSSEGHRRGRDKSHRCNFEHFSKETSNL
ncbi:hypothetical protein Aduo_000626 [Ancylostoma duodenale]